MRPTRMLALALLFGVAIAGWLYAVTESDNVNVPVPTNNGTSSNTSITTLAEQYVGFYGNLTIVVRNNTSPGNNLYIKNVQYGKLFFFKAGAVPGTKFLNASTNATVNNNFSLTGFYNLSSNFQFTSVEPYCGVNNASYLNTTDNRRTAVLYDNAGAGTENYFFCTEVAPFTSTNGFGTIGYEIIVAKTTGNYQNYDIWFDLT